MKNGREEPRIREIIVERAENSAAPLDVFAVSLVEPIRKFYQDPAVEAEFQEWQRQRRRVGA